MRTGEPERGPNDVRGAGVPAACRQDTHRQRTGPGMDGGWSCRDPDARACAVSHRHAVHHECTRQDITLGGLNILSEHCIITNELVSAHDGRYRVTLEALPGAEVYVNGKPLRRFGADARGAGAGDDGVGDAPDALGMTGGTSVVLHDGDRIVVGHSHLYLLRDPRETAADLASEAAATAGMNGAEEGAAGSGDDAHDAEAVHRRLPVTPQDAVREYVRRGRARLLVGMCSCAVERGLTLPRVLARRWSKPAVSWRRCARWAWGVGAASGTEVTMTRAASRHRQRTHQWQRTSQL